MITLIGTGHVFDLSNALLAIFDEKEPEVLCIELDKQRYNTIMIKKSNPEVYKNARADLPFIYKRLAKFQENMADEYGVEVGNEMLTAINYAQSHQLPLEFIDMNAQQLFIKMWKSMKFIEKFRLLLSGFAGIFLTKKRVEKEIENLQDEFDVYLEEISKKFPTIKKVLIDDRNNYMVNRIKIINENFQKIVVLIGDGHVPGISELLKKENIEFETIRLQDLRSYHQESDDKSSAHFSINYKP